MILHVFLWFHMFLPKGRSQPEPTWSGTPSLQTNYKVILTHQNACKSTLFHISVVQNIVKPIHGAHVEFLMPTMHLAHLICLIRIMQFDTFNTCHSSALK